MRDRGTEAALDRRMANRSCEVCGKDYEWAFQVVTAAGRTRTFDTFECAIEGWRPMAFFCSAHRARPRAASEHRDHP